MSDKKKKWGSSVSEQLQLKPADFEWENQELLDQKTNDWLNREKFSYDIGSDPMYQQYKEQYSALGKLAMEDTMGQASALTGGYANSYAQTVGQQAYQQYMDQLNAMVPELYSMARSNYEAEGQDLYNQIALLEGQRSQAFSEHQAELSDWYNYLSFLQQREASYRSSGGGGSDIPEYILDRLEQGFASDEEKMAFLVGQAQTGAITSAQMGQLAAGYKYDDTGELIDPADTGGVVDLSEVPDWVWTEVAGFTSAKERQDYLNGITGTIITPEEATGIYARYIHTQDAPSKRRWKKEYDGGSNWFGLDMDGKVKDQYGNVYTMVELVDLFVEEGMTRADAKKKAMQIQKDLEIS